MYCKHADLCFWTTRGGMAWHGIGNTTSSRWPKTIISALTSNKYQVAPPPPKWLVSSRRALRRRRKKSHIHLHYTFPQCHHPPWLLTHVY